MPIIGNDSKIAKLKSCQRTKNVPKSLMAVETKYEIPEFFIWLTSIVPEKGMAAKEINKRDENPNSNLLVCRNSCSRLIARIIRSKSPTGGSFGLR